MKLDWKQSYDENTYVADTVGYDATAKVTRISEDGKREQWIYKLVGPLGFYACNFSYATKEYAMKNCERYLARMQEIRSIIVQQEKCPYMLLAAASGNNSPNLWLGIDEPGTRNGLLSDKLSLYQTDTEAPKPFGGGVDLGKAQQASREYCVKGTVEHKCDNTPDIPWVFRFVGWSQRRHVKARDLDDGTIYYGPTETTLSLAVGDELFLLPVPHDDADRMLNKLREVSDALLKKDKEK